ncbi:hypothetical protein HG530_011198 [Fusarium avenaceum]|nr:hypothetical protein HG530_011198 [Fusarium avenaceum]
MPSLPLASQQWQGFAILSLRGLAQICLATLLHELLLAVSRQYQTTPSSLGTARRGSCGPKSPWKLPGSPGRVLYISQAEKLERFQDLFTLIVLSELALYPFLLGLLGLWLGFWNTKVGAHVAEARHSHAELIETLLHGFEFVVLEFKLTNEVAYSEVDYSLAE